MDDVHDIVAQHIKTRGGDLDTDVPTILLAIKAALDRYIAGWPDDNVIAAECAEIAMAAELFSKALNRNSRAWAVIARHDVRADHRSPFPHDATMQALVDRVAVASRAAESTRRTRGRPENNVRRGLAIELALIWRALTGQPATHSGADTFDDPRTAFSRFVAACLASSHDPALDCEKQSFKQLTRICKNIDATLGPKNTKK